MIEGSTHFFSGAKPYGFTMSSCAGNVFVSVPSFAAVSITGCMNVGFIVPDVS